MIPYGMWMVAVWITMESAWIVCGLCEEYAWIAMGVRELFMHYGYVMKGRDEL